MISDVMDFAGASSLGGDSVLFSYHLPSSRHLNDMAKPDPSRYIAGRASAEKNAECAEIIDRISENYSKKLWHQLTEDVKAAVLMPEMGDKCGLYSEFCKAFETKLNAVSLVQIVIGSARAELAGKPDAALAFVSELLDTDERKGAVSGDPEAKVLLLSEVATLHLRASDTATCKKHIASARELVDASVEMTGVVHSAFYRAAAEYHKVVGTAADFFKNALQFLAYTPAETLQPTEQSQWAFDLGIAALVGEDVYNFGEVLAKGIMGVLKESEHTWLLELLEAFHEGDLVRFDKVCELASKQMNDQPALVAHQEFIRQKITLLALMQLASTRTESRNLSFKEIETKCRMPPEEVEFLLMRAMSLKLITGVIDNVDEVVQISRVQPRVMDRTAIGNMASHLKNWCANVTDTLETMGQSSATFVESA